MKHADLGMHEVTKLAAVACYRSQVAAFGGPSEINRALRADHRGWDGGEPLWRPG